MDYTGSLFCFRHVAETRESAAIKGIIQPTTAARTPWKCMTFNCILASVLTVQTIQYRFLFNCIPKGLCHSEISPPNTETSKFLFLQAVNVRIASH